MRKEKVLETLMLLYYCAILLQPCQLAEIKANQKELLQITNYLNNLIIKYSK